jgi:hypothetical protein
MEGKMGPAQQFLPRIPDFNADIQNREFYNLAESDEEDSTSAQDHVGIEQGGFESYQDSDGEDDAPFSEDDPGLQALLGERVLSSQLEQAHFFVPHDDGWEGNEDSAVDKEDHGGNQSASDAQERHEEHCDDHGGEGHGQGNQREGPREQRDAHRNQGNVPNQNPLLLTPNFFQLPQVPAPIRRSNRSDLLVDYNKSIIMTGDEYVRAMEQKAARKEAAEREKQSRWQELEVMRAKRAEERTEREVQKMVRQSQREARRAFNECWSAAAVSRAGDLLHQQIRSGLPPPPGAYTGRFLWFCPDICRKNQAIVLERRRTKREGRQPQPLLRTTPPPGCTLPIHGTASTSLRRNEIEPL